ncbi:MAG: EamA family transporter [Clostridia bacterium]|nr:EamA family transporter [Clostridia bacterium]
MRLEKEEIKTKNVLLLLSCYIIWGFQPLYFNQMDVEAMFLLTSRMLLGGIVLFIYLLIRGRKDELIAAFKDKDLMLKHLIPGAIFLFLDWGIYTWAVMNEHIMDSSMGYYVSPLVTCFLGIILFKERFGWEVIAGIALIATGILVSGNGFSNAPFVSISLMFCAPLYNAFMKKVNIDGMISTAVQLLCASPFCVAFILIARHGENGLGSMDLTQFMFLFGAGLATMIPIVFLAVSIRFLPLTLVGFMQYLSPTFSILCGYLLGQSISHDQLISYIFIWVGVIIYTTVTTVRSKKEAS